MNARRVHESFVHSLRIALWTFHTETCALWIQLNIIFWATYLLADIICRVDHNVWKCGFTTVGVSIKIQIIQSFFIEEFKCALTIIHWHFIWKNVSFKTLQFEYHDSLVVGMCRSHVNPFTNFSLDGTDKSFVYQKHCDQVINKSEY